jgi:hypothetical protein
MSLMVGSEARANTSMPAHARLEALSRASPLAMYADYQGPNSSIPPTVSNGFRCDPTPWWAALPSREFPCAVSPVLHKIKCEPGAKTGLGLFDRGRSAMLLGYTRASAQNE